MYELFIASACVVVSIVLLVPLKRKKADPYHQQKALRKFRRERALEELAASCSAPAKPRTAIQERIQPFFETAHAEREKKHSELRQKPEWGWGRFLLPPRQMV